MIAISARELALLPPAGKFAPCPHCGKKRKIEYAQSTSVYPAGAKPTVSLGFVSCGKESYLVAINSKLLKQKPIAKGSAR